MSQKSIKFHSSIIIRSFADGISFTTTVFYRLKAAWIYSLPPFLRFFIKTV